MARTPRIGGLLLALCIPLGATACCRGAKKSSDVLEKWEGSGPKAAADARRPWDPNTPPALTDDAQWNRLLGTRGRVVPGP